jgi:6-pyruvoyltetrahydropterin/6-carboxytetrahydropterin synthase
MKTPTRSSAHVRTPSGTKANTVKAGGKRKAIQPPPIVAITRRATFCASHRLHCDHLTDAQNQAIFGKCNNPNGHGHNYVLEVTVRGPVSPDTGMVMNLVDLKQAITEEILDRFDHKHLNLDVPEFRDLNPTSENVCVVIWRLLEPRLPNGVLYEVKLFETENNLAVFWG